MLLMSTASLVSKHSGLLSIPPQPLVRVLYLCDEMHREISSNGIDAVIGCMCVSTVVHCYYTRVWVVPDGRLRRAAVFIDITFSYTIVKPEPHPEEEIHHSQQHHRCILCSTDVLWRDNATGTA